MASSRFVGHEPFDYRLGLPSDIDKFGNDIYVIVGHEPIVFLATTSILKECSEWFKSHLTIDAGQEQLPRIRLTQESPYAVRTLLALCHGFDNAVNPDMTIQDTFELYRIAVRLGMSKMTGLAVLNETISGTWNLMCIAKQSVLPSLGMKLVVPPTDEIFDDYIMMAFVGLTIGDQLLYQRMVNLIARTTRLVCGRLMYPVADKDITTSEAFWMAKISRGAVARTRQQTLKVLTEIVSPKVQSATPTIMCITEGLPSCSGHAAALHQFVARADQEGVMGNANSPSSTSFKIWAAESVEKCAFMVQVEVNDLLREQNFLSWEPVEHACCHPLLQVLNQTRWARSFAQVFLTVEQLAMLEANVVRRS